ncbi:hypothetical protein F4677DRAFT_235814 [Hypoxylon crocopeplum]|nr:hypothetical protein F4677DRAFT_235814 [Hypoxylon crocopeplum]
MAIMNKMADGLEGNRLNKAATTTAGEPETRFENVNLLKSLLGDKEKESSESPKHSISLGTSTDKSIESDDYEKNAQSPTTCVEGDHMGMTRYQADDLSETSVSGNVSPGSLGSFSSRSHKSLDTPRSSLSDTTTSKIQRPYTEPGSEASKGLKALFQEPVRLKSYSTSYPSRPVYSQTSPDHPSPTSPSLLDSPSTMSSITSLASYIYERRTDDGMSSIEFETAQLHATQHRPLLTSSQSEQRTEGIHRPDSQTSRNSQAQYSRSQRIALSQIFVYQARVTSTPVVDEMSATPTYGKDIPLGLECASSQFHQSTSTEGELTRHASISSVVALDSSAPHESTIDPQDPQPSNSGLMILEPDNRRGVVDSQAWQRKTRLLQLDLPNYHLEIDTG